MQHGMADVRGKRRRRTALAVKTNWSLSHARPFARSLNFSATLGCTDKGTRSLHRPPSTKIFFSRWKKGSLQVRTGPFFATFSPLTARPSCGASEGWSVARVESGKSRLLHSLAFGVFSNCGRSPLTFSFSGQGREPFEASSPSYSLALGAVV